MKKEISNAVFKTVQTSFKYGNTDQKLVASVIVVLAELHDRLGEIVKEMKRK